MSGKPEIWFYHLERSTLDQVLPTLLEKTLERGWRAMVKSSHSHRLDDVDELLWTFRDDSFLPHGRADQPHAQRQPVLLSETEENLNGAQALFIVDDADMGATEGFERCFIIFDGRDEPALQHARGRWKALKDQGANLAYWKQSDEGRWEKGGLIALGLLAACSTPVSEAPAPRAIEQAQLNPPVGSRMPTGQTEDFCKAGEMQYLVGKSRTEIPVPVEVINRRVTCTTCPVTHDFSAYRLNILYNEQTGVIEQVRCG